MYEKYLKMIELYTNDLYIKRDKKDIVVGGRERCIFISALIIGLLAHGFMLTTKIVYSDEIFYSFGLGATFSSNRWGLGCIYYIGSKLFDFFSNPMINGLLSICLIALSVMLLYRMLDFKMKISAILLSAVMVSFPVIASIFICMFTAPVYQLALLFSIAAIYILKDELSPHRILLSSILISISLGIYQAYITVSICVTCLVLMNKLLKNTKAASVIKNGIVILISGILGLVEYFALNKFFIWATDTVVTDYKGMDSMGTLDLHKIPYMIINTYKEFFLDYTWKGINAFPIIVIGIAVMAIAGIVLLIKILRKINSHLNKSLFIVILLFFPLCANSIFLLSTDPSYSVTTLMQYSLVMSFGIPLLVIENTELEIGAGNKLLSKFIIFSFVIVISGYIYLDNSCYLKATYLQKQADSYYTCMINSIKQTKEYKDEYPVAFIGDFNFEDETIYYNPDIRNIRVTGYNAESLKNMLIYRPIEYMKINCGYSPQIIEDTNALENNTYVKDMPTYPDYGSIKVIDDVVVVKLNTND